MKRLGLVGVWYTFRLGRYEILIAKVRCKSVFLLEEIRTYNGLTIFQQLTFPNQTQSKPRAVSSPRIAIQIY